MGQNKKTPKRGRGMPYWETKRGEPILQKHHVTPSSRGGKRGRILAELPSHFHWAWHLLFGNLKPLEILDILLKVWFQGGSFEEYQTSIGKKSEAPKTMTPDRMISALMRLVFPKDWVPSEKLIGILKKRRERLSNNPKG